MVARRGRPPAAPLVEGKSPRVLNPEEELALSAVAAEAYYLRDESKVQIAQRLGMSRFQVARLLQLAKDEKIVEIQIKHPNGIDRSLGQRLAEALGLTSAVVVASTFNTSPANSIGAVLAVMIAKVVQPGNVVGLTWNPMLLSMVENLKKLPCCSMVQLGGHLSQGNGAPGSVEVVRLAAEIADGSAHVLYAPLVVPDAHAADSLRKQADIAATLAMLDDMDVAVISVGAWLPTESLVYDSVSDGERDMASREGVVGEINGRLFDSRGRIVPEVIDDRVIGARLDQLERVPEVIATSFGSGRAEAVIAAAHAGLFTTLIVDQYLALAILQRTHQGSGAD